MPGALPDRRPAFSRPAADGPIRVMVVDDSAVVRASITRTLETEPDIEVVATAANGEIAVKTAKRQPLDIIVLDIEMPVMDGMTALPLLLEAAPAAKILMASTLTARNASISLKALANGASDYVPKPTSTQQLRESGDFTRELVEKVRALGEAKRSREAREAPQTGRVFPTARRAAPASFTLRKPGFAKPDVLAIGSSTGGPQALLNVLKGLKGTVKTPIFITQHMPATFTRILAEHITRGTGWECREAVDGEPVVPERVFLAPGEFHMLVKREGDGIVVRLDDSPPVNFCRPAVDPMLRSIVEVYRGRTLAVILTGMGQDGMKGGEAVVNAGGTVVAQDESTSVVWGMPGAVATAGLCSAVLPLSDIAPTVCKLMMGKAI